MLDGVWCVAVLLVSFTMTLGALYSLNVGSPVLVSSFFLDHSLILVERAPPNGFALILEGIWGCQFLSLSGFCGVNLAASYLLPFPAYTSVYLFSQVSSSSESRYFPVSRILFCPSSLCVGLCLKFFSFVLVGFGREQR